MDLIFTQSETGKSWVAEFEATADFNLHIERDKGGNLMLYQRTNGGGWDIVNDFANPRFGAIDYDCAALIYPKFIKVVSEVEPTYAAVTSAGEVTEIKSQDKSVEVTSNGTIDVTPDAGFAYLNSVKVKTNVPTSGEGGGSTGGGTASSVEYLDLRGLDAETKQSLKDIAFLGKKERYIFPIPIVTTFGSDSGEIEYVAVDLGTKCGMYEIEGYLTLAEFIEIIGAKPMLDSIPRITEEEFYTL